MKMTMVLKRCLLMTLLLIHASGCWSLTAKEVTKRTEEEAAKAAKEAAKAPAAKAADPNMQAYIDKEKKADADAAASTPVR